VSTARRLASTRTCVAFPRSFACRRTITTPRMRSMW
jgi:hypothetical protein